MSGTNTKLRSEEYWEAVASAVLKESEERNKTVDQQIVEALNNLNVHRMMARGFIYVWDHVDVDEHT